MKLKIKYTSTKKFVLNFNGSSLGELTAAVRSFVAQSYGEECPHLVLSLNGRSPLEGTADTPLQQLGLVPADLLTVINDPTAAAVLSAGSSGSATDAASNTNRASDAAGSSGSSSSKPAAAAAATVAAGGHSSSSGGDAAGGGRPASPTRPPATLLEVAADSDLPPSLHQLLQLCQPASASQMVALLAHLTMLECGFRVQDSSSSTATASSSSAAAAAAVVAAPASSWNQHLATLSYTHASYRDFSCTLVMLTVGNVKQLHVSFPDQDVEISTKVNTGDYVKSAAPGAAAGAVLDASSLVNVSRLAQRLRNELLMPLQLAAHRQLGLPSPFHLAGLPSELVERVLRLLDVPSALRLAQTCPRLHQLISSNQALWRYYCKRDLPQHQLQHQECDDYRLRYKSLYQEEKKQRSLKSEGLWDPPPGERPSFYPHPYNPYAPQPDNPFAPQPDNPFYPRMPHPFGDPDSPHYGGEVPYGPHLPHLPQAPPSLIRPPFMHQDPLNPFGDASPGPLYLRPRRRGGPSGGGGRGGGAGGFQFI